MDEASIGAQQVAMPLAVLTSRLGVLVPVGATLLLIQLPVNAPGKAADDGSRIWISDSQVRPGWSSWILAFACSALAFVAILRVNWWMGELSWYPLSLLVPVSCSLSL